MQCISTVHNNDGTEATHQASVMLWSSQDMPVELRMPQGAQVFKLEGQVYCAACQKDVTKTPPDMTAMKQATGNDQTLDYEHPQWCFLGLE